MTHAHIKILPFTGKNIKNYLPSIARLRMEILREYPFMQEKNAQEEMKLLKKYAQNPDAIVIMVFDGSAIVGASTGIPFSKESKELHKPFLDKQLDPAHYYYCSESLLLKPYRGRGIAHHLFDLHEKHAQRCKKFKHICFCAFDRQSNDPIKPEDPLPLDDFWRKRGFAEHADLYCHLDLNNFKEEESHKLRGTFWIKAIP